jgi:hypothetical protein
LAGEVPVLYDLQDSLITMVGDVLEGQWRSVAGDERWRRPWRRVIVPDEGPANMEGQGVHKLHESAGMLLQYLIGPGMGQKGVIDGGTARVLTSGDGGGGVLQAGMPEGGGEVVEELLWVGVVLLVLLVGVKRPCTSGSTARLNGRRSWSFVGAVVQLFQ